jgi:sec-independent protein translocase protein TatA
MVGVLAFISGWEIILVGFIFVVLFGSRLPGVMQSLGQSVTSFKKGLKDNSDEFDPEQKNQDKKSS